MSAETFQDRPLATQLADALEAERHRNELLRSQIFDLLAHIRSLESAHNLPASKWVPID